MKRILICGCARSGNTLMLHLMGTGFENTEILYDGPGGEVMPRKEDEKEGKAIVGKFPKKAGKLEKWLDNEEFGAIYMMRDPRDVLVSKHFLKPKRYWVPTKRWIDAAKIAEELQGKERILMVSYEELLSDPKKVQEEIASAFGLSIAIPFEKCHEHFDQDDQTNISNMNGARPLDPGRIGNWKNDPAKKKHIEKRLKDVELVKYMKKFGYV